MARLPQNHDDGTAGPTAEDIDALLRAFAAMRALPSPHPDTPEARASRYPIYTGEVLAFFMLAGQPCWSDYGYAEKDSAAMVKDDARIASASMDEIRTMLTRCVRGERFCDGFWGSLHEGDRLDRIMARLAELRAKG
jgi:hypothetical protein